MYTSLQVVSGLLKYYNDDNESDGLPSFIIPLVKSGFLLVGTEWVIVNEGSVEIDVKLNSTLYSSYNAELAPAILNEMKVGLEKVNIFTQFYEKFTLALKKQGYDVDILNL